MTTLQGIASPLLHALRRWSPPRPLSRLRGLSAKEFRFLGIIIGDIKRPILPAPVKPDPAQWQPDRVTAAWIGHSTVLINFYGVTIITDPVLAARAGINLGVFVVGPKRYVAPALKFQELPPVDLVLLSHAHMDHFDLPTLRKFGRQTKTITARATLDLLSRTRLRHQAAELGWGQKVSLTFEGKGLPDAGEIEIEAFEVNHWGARVRTDDFRSYNGYVLRRKGRTIVFGGDTANTNLFRKLRGRGAPSPKGYDLAIMPIGAYNPWINSHCTPEQAVNMAEDVGAYFVGPVHHQTFCLSQEPMDEPIRRFEARLATRPERVAWRQVGETFQLPDAGGRPELPG